MPADPPGRSCHCDLGAPLHLCLLRVDCARWGDTPRDRDVTGGQPAAHPRTNDPAAWAWRPGAGLSSPLSSRARRSLPPRRPSAPSARRRSATWRRRRGSRVVEAECRIPRLELVRALEVADDLAALCIRGHPVPGPGREIRRAGLDECMEPLGHGAILIRHLRDLREHVAFPVPLARARAAARLRLRLSGALLHRGPFLVRESRVGRGCPLGGLLRGLLRAHRSLLCTLFHVLPARAAEASAEVEHEVRNSPTPS